MTRFNRTLFCATALSILLAAYAAAAPKGVEIRVLSGRPDMVTGGDALVEVTTAPEKFTATLNGQDISKSFTPAKTGTLIGHLEGLKTGKNALEIKSAKGSAKLELVNYPITGPVFSGPHQKPFVCQTEQAGLGPALDGEDRRDVRVQVDRSSSAGRTGPRRSGAWSATCRIQGVRSVRSTPS
jgi:hypothetical protein